MNDLGLEQRFAAAFPSLILEETDEQVLVACSGGGDSIALLHLTARLLGPERVRVATINHNLRDVQAELDLVTRHCMALGVPHQVLGWHWDGQGNLQAAARDARRELLNAHSGHIDACWILLGHTKDDQAETFLMRLARGSGVDGLAAMTASDNLTLRPLLDITRSDLRAWLTGQGLDWAEDPSNDDLRFDRVKARAMMDHLSGLGLSSDRLAATADRMRAERDALIHAARQFAKTHSATIGGDVVIEASSFAELPVSMQTRLLAGIVRWFSGAPYKPRAAELDQWLTRMLTGKPAPLCGVLAHAPDPTGAIRFYREPSAMADPVVFGRSDWRVLWDNRWEISHTGSHTESHTGCNIAALGAALSEIPNWRGHELPRKSLETSPAIWRDETCVASLLLNPPEGWRLSTADWWHALK